MRCTFISKLVNRQELELKQFLTEVTTTDDEEAWFNSLKHREDMRRKKFFILSSNSLKASKRKNRNGLF